MAVRYLGTTSTFPQAGRTTDIVGAPSGGTLAGGQKAQIVFDDAVYDATNEGKQRLIGQVRTILAVLENARSWPVDTTV